MPIDYNLPILRRAGAALLPGRRLRDRRRGRRPSASRSTRRTACTARPATSRIRRRTSSGPCPKAAAPTTRALRRACRPGQLHPTSNRRSSCCEARAITRWPAGRANHNHDNDLSKTDEMPASTAMVDGLNDHDIEAETLGRLRFQERASRNATIYPRYLDEGLEFSTNASRRSYIAGHSPRVRPAASSDRHERRVGFATWISGSCRRRQDRRRYQLARTPGRM